MKEHKPLLSPMPMSRFRSDSYRPCHRFGYGFMACSTAEEELMLQQFSLWLEQIFRREE